MSRIKKAALKVLWIPMGFVISLVWNICFFFTVVWYMIFKPDECFWVIHETWYDRAKFWWFK